MVKVSDLVKDKYEIIIFMIGLLGVFGSLYFSEIVKVAPCDLCWYQRILFYPIFILSASALSFKEKLSPKVVLVFSIFGTLLAGYHYLLQKFGIGKQFINCAIDNPCTVVDVEYLGFITIPLLSLAGFLLIALISIIKLKLDRSSEKNT